MALRRRRDPAAEIDTSPGACREAALRCLERTRRTRADLEERLRDDGYPAVVIESVLDRLTEVGLIDDAEFARAWLASRWGRKPNGWRRLHQELRDKGVAEEHIEHARESLAQQGSAPSELDGAAKVVAQARRRMSRVEPRKQRQRLYALLVRRGYDPDTIRRALAIEDPLESGIEA
jgi:regulatory protein